MYIFTKYNFYRRAKRASEKIRIISTKEQFLRFRNSHSIAISTRLQFLCFGIRDANIIFTISQFLRFHHTYLSTIFAGLQFLLFRYASSHTISTKYNFYTRAKRASEKMSYNFYDATISTF